MNVATKKTAYMEKVWLERLREEFEKPYMKSLKAFLAREEESGAEVFPPHEWIFNAFRLTPFDLVKVVIIGQDPYHNPGQAEGLSFSVPKGIPIPPSLQNIYKEIQADLGLKIPNHGSLIDWAIQGVLLLNTTLTVRKNEPKSHYGQGWEMFTDRVVELLCERKDPIVFLLWGKSALDKFQHISSRASHHLALIAPHPSPFSAHTGFLGCKHFSKANEFLKQVGKEPIDWEIRP